MRGMFRDAHPSITVAIQWLPEERYVMAHKRLSRKKWHWPTEAMAAERQHLQMAERPRWSEQDITAAFAKAHAAATEEPIGILRITLCRGEDFVGKAGTQWRCRLRVPVRLHGQVTTEAWLSEPSTCGPPELEWAGNPEESNGLSEADGTSQVFKIDWSQGGIDWSVPLKCDPGTASEKLPDEDRGKLFRKQVLETLKDRARCIESLERVIQTKWM